MKFEADLKDQEISSLRREAEFDAFRRRILLLGAGLSLIIIALLFNRYRFQKKAHSGHPGHERGAGQGPRQAGESRPRGAGPRGPGGDDGELAAAFAHELNQPLAAIKANARAARNILGPPVGDDEEVGEALVDIRDDAERATEIIRRLREMMRKGEERREVHDLNTIVQSAVKFVAGAAHGQGVDLQ